MSHRGCATAQLAGSPYSVCINKYKLVPSPSILLAFPPLFSLSLSLPRVSLQLSRSARRPRINTGRKVVERITKLNSPPSFRRETFETFLSTFFFFSSTGERHLWNSSLGRYTRANIHPSSSNYIAMRSKKRNSDG